MSVDEGGPQVGSAKPVKIYTSGSRLSNFRTFLADANRDLSGSWQTASRFFKRGMAQKYRYSSLGLLWAFLPAVITALVLVAGQKTRIISHAHGDVPPPFYGVFGLALMQTFLDGLGATRTVFSNNQMILRRSNIVIEGLIGATIIDAAFSVFIRILVLIVAFLFFRVHPVITVPLAIFGFAGTLFLGCGVGLVLAPPSSLKRDIDNLMSFLPWILFAITPIFVKPVVGSVPETLYKVNPLSWIFDSTRTAAYGAPGSVYPAIWSLVAGLAVLILGWMFCRIWHPYVVERSLV